MVSPTQLCWRYHCLPLSQRHIWHNRSKLHHNHKGRRNIWKTSRSLEYPLPCDQGTKSAYYTHMALMDKWPRFCTSTDQDSSKELNLEWIAQWLLSSTILKIPGALIMPMGMPIMPVWANDQDTEHLQAKMVPKNLIWKESALWLLSYGIRKVWAGRMDGRTKGWGAFHSPPFFL